MSRLKDLMKDLGVSPGSLRVSLDETDSRERNKETLDGLNNRLELYLNKVEELKDKNQELRTEINAKGTKPQKLDWKQTLEVQEQIKKITEENAERLLKINNLEKKLEEETRACWKAEKELEDLQMVLEDTKLTREHLKQEIDQLTSELNRLTTGHQNEVDSLCENLTSEEDSQNPKLADVVNAIRKKYDEITNNNTKEMEKWYKDQLERIKQQDAQNLEALKSGNSERTKLLTKKQNLEIEINALTTKNTYLKETLENRVTVGFKDKADDLKVKLEKLISQIDDQQTDNQDLLNITDSLHDEIQYYKNLLNKHKPEREEEGQENDGSNEDSQDMSLVA